MPAPLRILYVGDLNPGTTCSQRYRALADLGCTLTPVSHALLDNAKRRTLWERVRRRLVGPHDWAAANQQLLERLSHATYDVLWIDKGLVIKASTLREAKRGQPRCRIVGYSPDDMYARHNQSPQFRKHVPCYDLFFTTKSYNVPELQSIGCQRVVFIGNAFDPHTHRPLHLTAEEKERYGGAVGFIGTWEPERATSLYRLATAGIPVRIWGNRWERCRQRHINLRIEGRALTGDEYAMGINAFDINLCFLRKQNRDVQTTRSVEIPACGAFMLAERTDEHRALFTEGLEAEFFRSDEELIGKVRRYVARPDDRARVAAAGRKRCIESGYSYAERMAMMLQVAGVPARPAARTMPAAPFIASAGVR